MANLKYAGEFLNSAGIRDVEVITIPPAEKVVNPAVTVPVLDLYVQGNICYRYKPEGFPRRDVIRTSPLRFTWEYRNPAYYSSDCSGVKEAVAVIGQKSWRGLPKDAALQEGLYTHLRTFRTSTNVFRFRTPVSVYYR